MCCILFFMNIKTVKLFYEDCYASSFEATVLNCRKRSDGLFETVLDRTLFYPEGGGQPCDLGNVGGADVYDVYEKDGEIVHITNETLGVGESVCGSVDFGRRFVFKGYTVGKIENEVTHEIGRASCRERV